MRVRRIARNVAIWIALLAVGVTAMSLISAIPRFWGSSFVGLLLMLWVVAPITTALGRRWTGWPPRPSERQTRSRRQRAKDARIDQLTTVAQLLSNYRERLEAASQPATVHQDLAALAAGSKDSALSSRALGGSILVRGDED